MRNPRDRAALRLEKAALLLGGVLVVAVLASAADNSADPRPTLLMIAGASSAYAIGRLLRRTYVALALLAMAVGVAAVVLVSPDILSGKPLASPLHYGNANGALLALGATAAVALAVARPGVTRWVGWTLAPLLVVATAMTESRAATALAFAVVVSTAAVVIARGKGAAAVTWGIVATLVLVVAGTTVLGLGYDGPGTAPSWAAQPLSERRIALWHDAVVLIGHHPVTGVGPGRFPTASPVARSDPDTRFAHSLPLELGAESGLAAGLAATALLVALAAAAAIRRRGASAVVATWAVAVFALQAGIDYVYRFPAIVLLAALLAGLTSGTVTGPDQAPPPGSESPEKAINQD